GLESTDASADAGRVLERALALARDSAAPQRTILWLSDFRGPGGRVDPAPERSDARLDLLLVDCATSITRPNVAVELVAVEPAAPLVGRPVDITVRLTHDAADEWVCAVGLELAGTVLQTRSVAVPAAGSALARLRVPRTGQVGWTHGRVTLPDDGFAPDNAARFALKVRERLRLLVCDPALDAPRPDPEASGRFLTRLFDPTGDGSTGGIEARRVRPDDATLDGIHAVVVCGYDTLERIGGLQRFAEQGGLVLVLAEERDAGSGTGPAWLAAWPAGAVTRPEPAGAVRFAAEAERDTALRDLTVRAERELKPRAGALPLLEFGGARPALVLAPVGQGFAISAGFGLAPAWGSFTFHPEIVALLHGLVARYAARPRVVDAVAGAQVRVPHGGAGSAQVARDGEPVAAARGETEFDLGRCLRAGTYAIAAEGDAEFQRYVAVNPDAKESLLARTREEAFAADFGDAPLVGEEADLAAVLAERRRGADYASWLLLAALAFALAEALLANRARTGGAAVRTRPGEPARAPAPETVADAPGVGG
ncbi:MAG: hypothetical protein ACYTFD_07285, partial [Planctomycetota bacterium]